MSRYNEDEAFARAERMYERDLERSHGVDDETCHQCGGNVPPGEDHACTEPPDCEWCGWPLPHKECWKPR